MSGKIVAQTWTEISRGLSNRPDGVTLHLTREDCEVYVDGFRAKYLKPGPRTDDYTQPDGPVQELSVDDGVIARIQAKRAVFEQGPQGNTPRASDERFRDLGVWVTNYEFAELKKTGFIPEKLPRAVG